VEDISDYIGRPGCFVWVALSDASNEELEEMQKEFNLHPLAVEDAHHGHQRPKVEEYGDSLFVVMHLVEPSAEGEHCTNVGEVDVFVGTNYVLSVRNRSKQGFLGVRERCEREPDLLRNGAGFVLYALMDAVVDRYFPVIDALEVELEAIEQQIFGQGGAARDKIKQLYDLKRRSMVLKRAVAPLLEAAGKMHGAQFDRLPPARPCWPRTRTSRRCRRPSWPSGWASRPWPWPACATAWRPPAGSSAPARRRPPHQRAAHGAERAQGAGEGAGHRRRAHHRALAGLTAAERAQLLALLGKAREGLLRLANGDTQEEE
jgi:hypothetical protein